MKAKKILSSILAGAMVLSAMSFTAFAAPELEAEENAEEIVVLSDETIVTEGLEDSAADSENVEEAADVNVDATEGEEPAVDGEEPAAEELTPITVIFKETDKPEVYEIALKAEDGKTINKLNSLDFQFVNASKNIVDETKSIAYEIEAAADITVNAVENYQHRYEFHFNGKDGEVGDTAQEIVIGTITFKGYGTLDFKVDSTVNTNAVHATTTADSIVDSYTAENRLLVINYESVNGENDSFIIGELKQPTKVLQIIITFNNNINPNPAEYQDMTVTVSGGDLADDLVFDLADQDSASTNGVVWDETANTYTITTTLTKDVLYSVKVEGAGYRTAYHSVHMTGDEDIKILNFWNNVKDLGNAEYIEENKGEKVTKNFLAGDIVPEGIINILDLSAVVSYFGKALQTDAISEYAKYDLNRDGVIDSKDVAYVLVSWGE